MSSAFERLLAADRAFSDACRSVIDAARRRPMVFTAEQTPNGPRNFKLAVDQLTEAERYFLQVMGESLQQAQQEYYEETRREIKLEQDKRDRELREMFDKGPG